MRITPVVLAAGRGERLGTTYPKPLAHIDTRRPVIGTILNRLMECGFGARDIGIVVGHNPVPIVEYIGAGFRYSAQDGLGSPAKAAHDWLMAQTDKPDAMLLIHADDGEWTPKDIYQEVLRDFDKTEVSSLVLTAAKDPEAHKLGFALDTHGNITTISTNTDKIDHFIAGVFCVPTADFEAGYSALHEQNTSAEIGVAGIMRAAFEMGTPLRGVVNPGPWKSINRLDGLLSARSLRRKQD
jgi:choline kinase